MTNNPASGTDGVLIEPVTITGGQVLTISWASGYAFPEAIVHYAGDEDSGVTFHACGHGGWTCGDWIVSSPYDYRKAVTNLVSATPSAWAVFLGLNDANVSVGDLTASQYQTELESLISTFRSGTILAALPLLLITPYQAGITVADSGGWPAYAQAVENAAASDGNAQVVNLVTAMPSYASDPALYYDDLHPNDAGHAEIASIIAGQIAPASGLLMATFP